MKKYDYLLALGALAGFLLVRGPALFSPFILPFETAFQESIALHHLHYGPGANRFLPVLAVIDGQRFYHTAHPPLLHLLYAGLYKIFGPAEWVTRFFSLLLFFASVLLWRALLGRQTPDGRILFPLAFFLPLPFLLCTTTNYEPLSLFMLSLLAWLILIKNAGLPLLVPVLLVGLAVDWPVYLAVPVLLLLCRRQPKLRRRLGLLLLLEAAFFVALQFYLWRVAGEATFFSHAPQRANPLGLFQAELFVQLGRHFSGLMGFPLTILSAAVSIGAVIPLLSSSAKKRGDSLFRLPSPLSFFALFFLVLFLVAPQLVSRHEVYLLYFVPFLLFAFHHLLARCSRPVLALAGVLVLCWSRDYILHQHRSSGFFGMADRLRNTGLKTAFASAAIGHWYFYDRIETVYPVSKAAAEWAAQNRPDLLHLDLRHEEVKTFRRGWFEESFYELHFSLPGEEVWLKKEAVRDKRRYLTAEFVSGRQNCNREPAFLMAGPGQDCPAGTWVQITPFYGANITSCRLSFYGWSEPPGPSGAALSFSLPWPAVLALRPALFPSLPTGRSDGVMFLALTDFPPDNKDECQLAFARFLQPGTILPAGTQIKMERNFALITLAGPRNDPAFDDALWLEPILHRSEDEDDE